MELLRICKYVLVVVVLRIRPGQGAACQQSDNALHMCQDGTKSGMHIFLDASKAVGKKGSCVCSVTSTMANLNLEISTQGGVPTGCSALVEFGVPNYMVVCGIPDPGTVTLLLKAGTESLIQLLRSDAKTRSDFCIAVKQTSPAAAQLSIQCMNQGIDDVFHSTVITDSPTTTPTTPANTGSVPTVPVIVPVNTADGVNVYAVVGGVVVAVVVVVLACVCCFRSRSAEPAITSQVPLPMTPDARNTPQNIYEDLDFDNSASNTDHYYSTIPPVKSTMPQQESLPSTREASNNSQNTDFENSVSDINAQCYQTLTPITNTVNAEDGGNNVQPEVVSNTYSTAEMSPPSGCPGSVCTNVV